MQACELVLPTAEGEQSLAIVATLFEPLSRCFALRRSDGSIFLHPPFSFTQSAPCSSHPHLVIPPVSTAFSFLRFHPKPLPDSAFSVIFITARPHAAGSSILLRAWILSSANSFTPIGLHFKCNRGSSSGAVIGLSHGFSIKIEGSTNFFAIYSVTALKIWVLSVKLSEDEKCVNLMKCAVVECTSPIYSLRISMGLLLLGEVNGVRIFPMRLLVKGMVRKRTSLEKVSVNGSRRWKSDGSMDKTIIGNNYNYDDSSNCSENMNRCYDGANNGLEKESRTSLGFPEEMYGSNKRMDMRKTLKLRQDSGDIGSFFVAFKSSNAQRQNCLETVMELSKAIAIHSLSKDRFFILDSNGYLHLLSLCSSDTGSGASKSCISYTDGCMMQMNCSMKVQLLSVLPDVSTRTQTLWISDGCHTIHAMPAADIDSFISEGSCGGCDRKLMQNSAVQAIFTSEKIQELTSYAADGVLVLCQGRMFVYDIP